MTTPTTASQRQPPRQHYMHKCVLGLSIPQVIVGSLCMLFQLILIGEDSYYHFVGQGLWAGILFVFAGVLGILSSRKRNTALILGFLTMSIIAAVATIGLLTASAIELADYTRRDRYRRYHRPYYSTTPPLTTTPNPGRVAEPLDAMMVFMALLQGVLAIMSSAYACHGLCGGNKNTQQSFMTQNQVQYVPGMDGQQQMVLVPVGQQATVIQAPAGPSGSAGYPMQGAHTPYYPGAQAPPPEYSEGREEKKQLVPE